MTDSVTILDQSGKVVKTGKEIFSLFKDAKEIYKEHRQELRQTAQLRLEGRPAPKLLPNIQEGDAASVASSARSHRSRASSHASHASVTRDKVARGRAPLTAEALSQIDEGIASDAGSTSSRSRLSKEGSDPARPTVSRRHTGFVSRGPASDVDLDARPRISRRHTAMNAAAGDEPRVGIRRRHTGATLSEVTSLPPYRESGDGSPRGSRPRLGSRVESVLGSVFGASNAPSGLSRRHTDRSLVSTRQPDNPPSYSALGSNGLLNRSSSVPDFHGEHIDMNLAYGDMPGPGSLKHSPQELELRSKVSKIDTLLLEAQCLQGTATAIITKLQANPEAMAAVALTLAQVSSMLKNFSPAMAEGLKLSSPATFALLSSPQFLIAGGVAAGITVVAFGGYKIIKKMAEQKALEAAPQQAISYEGTLSTIDSWRRGVSIAGSEVGDDASTILSVGTSVEGEIITPEANRRKDERRRDRSEARSVASTKRPTMPRKGTSSRSAVRSDRSISYHSESRVGRAGGDDESERGREKPRRGEDKLGNELIVRPRAERASSARSVASVTSVRSAVSSKSEARDKSRREAEEDSGDDKEESTELVMYKANRRKKADKDATSTGSIAATEPSIIVDKVDETDDDKQKRREERERRRRERKQRESREPKADEQSAKKTGSRREALASLLSKSTISEKSSVISVRSEKEHRHRRPKVLVVGQS